MSKWSEDEDRVLIDMYSNGATCAEIGEELGRTRDSVANRRLRLIRNGRITRAVRRAWSDEDFEIAKSLYLRGVARNVIAAALGRQPQEITTKLNKCGVYRPASIKARSRPQKWSPETAAAAMENAMRGLRFEDHPAAISRRMPKIMAPALPDRSLYGGSL